MQVEFTDRYGGNPPSWLVGCHGPCEAMGCYPSDDPAEWPEGAEPDDIGYVFVPCPDCGGTGRVSYWRSLARIPRWLGKGVKFLWDTNLGCNRECRAPWHNRWQHFRLTFACAFLADLGLWRP